MIDGGQTVDDCRALLAAFTADGTVDYFSLDVGDNWGRVSYIQPGFYAEAEWAPLAGQVRSATNLPVVYVGRVTSVETAERILADGHADLVGFARAAIADPDLVVKSLDGRERRSGRASGSRSASTAAWSRACRSPAGSTRTPVARTRGVRRAAADPRSVLVVGGGPAGTEFAGQMAERGHRVQLWERDQSLGGQLAVAARLRMNASYGHWIRWQEGRLQRAGVDVVLGREATADGHRPVRGRRRGDRHRCDVAPHRRAGRRSAVRRLGDRGRDAIQSVWAGGSS